LLVRHRAGRLDLRALPHGGSKRGAARRRDRRNHAVSAAIRAGQAGNIASFCQEHAGDGRCSAEVLSNESGRVAALAGLLAFLGCGGVAGGCTVNFQDMIFALERYWADQGCIILQPYDIEVGAGTMHPATFLRVLGPEPWRAAYVQPSRRPTDGRYGENPNRLQHYYQYQVILKPSPD